MSIEDAILKTLEEDVYAKDGQVRVKVLLPGAGAELSEWLTEVDEVIAFIRKLDPSRAQCQVLIGRFDLGEVCQIGTV